jgi:hypothetical protein
MRSVPIGALLAIVIGLAAGPAAAQISVNPTGANVRHVGSTTVFLTFRNLAPDQTAAEGVWCGEIQANDECVPGTEFGRLPAKFDIGRLSGRTNRNFTDVMNIPASVTRRAYLAARSGDDSEFFYVRRFVSSSGNPDEFVAVSCRLASGGARSQLAILEARLRFDIERPVLFVPRGSPPPPLGADLVFNGTGRLRGRWEVVQPGDPQPAAEDLLTEGALPRELRALQRRYTVVERFDVFLPPSTEFFLKGPDPRRLPHDVDGLYQVLLRIEASDERETRSDTLEEVVFAGGVAGFPIPPLRYYVGSSDEAEEIRVLGSGRRLEPITPREGSRQPADERLNFSWVADPDAVGYRIEVESDGEVVLEALVTSAVSSYSAPPWIGQSGDEDYRWRVVSYGPDGDPIGHSHWVAFELDD